MRINRIGLDCRALVAGPKVLTIDGAEEVWQVGRWGSGKGVVSAAPWPAYAKAADTAAEPGDVGVWRGMTMTICGNIAVCALESGRFAGNIGEHEG